MRRPSGRQEIVDKAIELGFKAFPDDEIKPGDNYLAWRNTGPVLLTCASVHRDSSIIGGCVNAEPIDGKIQYAFDLWECVKVVLP